MAFLRDQQFWEWVREHNVPIEKASVKYYGIGLWNQCVLHGRGDAARLPEVCEFLLNIGVDVNGIHASGNTPLMWTTGIEDDDAFKECVGLLLEAGANINARDDRGQNVLFWTQVWDKRGDATKVWDRTRFFLELGVDATRRDRQGFLFWERLDKTQKYVKEHYDAYGVLKDKEHLDSTTPLAHHVKPPIHRL